MDHEELIREHSSTFAAHGQRIQSLERDVRDLKQISRDIERSMSRMGWMLAGTFGSVLLQLAIQFLGGSK